MSTNAQAFESMFLYLANDPSNQSKIICNISKMNANNRLYQILNQASIILIIQSKLRTSGVTHRLSSIFKIGENSDVLDVAILLIFFCSFFAK